MRVSVFIGVQLYLNTEKQLPVKTRGRRVSAFIVSRCLDTPMKHRLEDWKWLLSLNKFELFMMLAFFLKNLIKTQMLNKDLQNELFVMQHYFLNNFNMSDVFYASFYGCSVVWWSCQHFQVVVQSLHFHFTQNSTMHRTWEILRMSLTILEV